MMRLIVVILFSLFSIQESGAATYYVAPANSSPAGNDAAAGDKNHPWASWEKAFSSRKPGDTVIFRGGVYPTTVTNGAGIVKSINGTSDKWVVFMNYPGEVPILDCSNVTSTWYGNNFGLKLSGSYYELKGLTVRNVWQINAVEPAELCYAFKTEGNNYTLENCTAHSTHGSGFWPHGSNVRITNCDSYDHCDSRTLAGHMPGNNGYGYFHYNTGTTGSIYYKDCRAWSCGDDGWALADNSYVELDGCWSFKNGRMEGAGNGFKIGFIPQKATIPVLRVVKNCIAAFNRASGLTTNDNNNYTIAPSHIYNNIAYHNGYYSEWKNPVYGFYLYSTNGTDQEELQRIFRNNISYKNQGAAVGDGYYHDVLYTHSHNSWDISGLTVADADFLSVDSTGISGPRQADGSLPALNFLKLASNSQLIDKGVDVGLPYTGSAPDLGIAEASATATAPVARITPPATTILTCATPSITLTATGGASYSWSDGTRVVGTSATLTVTSPGQYTVTATSADGLTDTESIAITQNITPPTVVLTNNTGTTILTCSTQAISVTASGGSSYSWHDGTKVVATTAALTITTPATYTVTVTGSNGCTATKAITITQDKIPPTVTLTNSTGTTILTCSTQAISVTASGGSSYSWHDGTKVVATTAAMTITAPATYTVTVTGSNGCTATKALTITQDKTPPTAAITNLTGTTVLTAATTAIGVTASGGSSYSWHDGTKVVATTASLTITAPATYTVTVTGSNGCTATKSIAITRADETLAPPVVSVTQPQCGDAGGTLQVTSPAPGTGYSYSLNGTDYSNTTGLFTAVPAGVFNVTARNSSGTVTPGVTVTVEPSPAEPAAPAATVTQQPSCSLATGTIVITSPAEGSGYTYSIDGMNFKATATFSGLASGSYLVTVKNITSGCISPASPLTVNPAPENNLTPVFAIFGPYPEGSTPDVLPQRSDNGILGSWSPATISTSVPGTYTYTFTPEPGQCAVSLTISVDILKKETSGSTQFSRQIASGNDDVEERANGTVVTNSPDIELVFDNYSTGNQVVGLRFTNITIPAKARVLRAYLQFTVAETTYGTTTLRIWGQNSDNAAPFYASKKNVSTRSRVKSTVSWSPTPQGGSAVGSRSLGQQTPDLSPILQEILNRRGWESGNSLAFIITGSGKRNAMAYEGSRSEAAELVVEYTTEEVVNTTALYTKSAPAPETGLMEGLLDCYPVPFREILHVRYQPGPDGNPVKMALYDLSGRTVKTLDPAKAQQEVSTGDLLPGIYLLRVTTNSREMVRKIVRQ